MADKNEKPVIIIPARRGSKGVPRKNRHLLDYTMSTIPLSWRNRVIISTNDKHIGTEVKTKYPDCRVHQRSDDSALDTASTKECINEVIHDFSLQGDIIMLYLTYPNRRWSDVQGAWKWYKATTAMSLLCREEVATHPYLCLREEKGAKGSQIAAHNLYRRQDYPPCFKLCHMITIFNTIEVEKLNNNLYNKDTIYYKILPATDIDTYEDLKKFKQGEHDG